jgi:hypothetical protein
MICPNCRIEVEGDRCPRCGARLGRVGERRVSSTEAGPERLSMRATLILVWETLKTSYFVAGLIVLPALLIIGLLLLVSWCKAAP